MLCFWLLLLLAGMSEKSKGMPSSPSCFCFSLTISRSSGLRAQPWEIWLSTVRCGPPASACHPARLLTRGIDHAPMSDENKVLIVKLGGLEPLIRQMLSPNVEVQCNAVGCITNLATHGPFSCLRFACPLL
jgi:Armadillo/beta-catenin-like repeat